MEPSQSTQDLERAIKELDGMYEDLSESYRRHSMAEGEVAETNTPDYDDEDYDIPRPAEGLFNTAMETGFPQLQSPQDPQIIDETPRTKSAQEIYPSLKSPKSPTASFHSEYSSGLGTLPKQSTGLVVESSFPAPPDFEPLPPVPPSPSDSDYDEVASDSDASDSDNFVYSHPVKASNKSSTSSSDYAEPHNPELISHDVIRVDKAEYRDAEDPDYDVVYSVPNSQRNSFAIGEVVKDPETETKIPMVVQMKRIDNTSVKVQNETVQREDRVEEHSFIVPRVDIRQNGKEAEEYKTVGNDVTRTQLPVDENGNVEEKHRATPASQTEQPTEEVDPPSNTSGRSIEKGRSMDVEAQRQKPKKQSKDCPCECRAAIPLMSVAIVICSALLIVFIVGFVYFGIQTEEYLKSVRNRITNEVTDFTTMGSDTTTGSGSGVK